MVKTPEHLLRNARQLRENQTDAEKLMWYLLRGRRFMGLKFRRQYPIAQYCLDFYCPDLGLAVELDGGQHNEPASRAHDTARTRALQDRGIQVLRFWNHDVLQRTESVLEALWQKCEEMAHYEETTHAHQTPTNPDQQAGQPGDAGMDSASSAD